MHLNGNLLQSKVRKEAALSAVDEQRRNKEATEAENAANIAKMAEHEAAVSTIADETLVSWRSV